MRSAEIVLAGLIVAGVDSAAGETLAIENPEGNVHVVVVPGQEIQAYNQAAGRAITKEDVRFEKIGETYFIDAFPADLTPIDLFVRVPYAWPLSIKTISGNVTINGNVTSALIETGTGAINLSVPVKTTALFVKSEEQPETLLLPADSGYRRDGDSKKGFRVETKRDRAGAIEIQAFAPSRIFVRDYMPVHDFDSDKPIPLELARPILRALRARHNRAEPAGERRIMVSVRTNPHAARTKPGDIMVIENGEPRPVVEVQPSWLGVDAVLIFQQIDRRGPMFSATRRNRAFLRRLIARVRDFDRVAMAQAEGGFLRVLSNSTTERGRLLTAYEDAGRSKNVSELLAATVLAHRVFELGDLSKKNVVIVVNSASDYNCMTRIPDKEIAGAVVALAQTGAPFYSVGGDCKDFDRLAKLSGGRSLALEPGKAEAAADRLIADLATWYAVTYSSTVPAGTTPDRVVVKVQGQHLRLRHSAAAHRSKPR